MDDFRYDPVWRRIPHDEYAKKLEGRFHERFARLEHLVNWGALSWLYPHATATKQAHHLGVEHNAVHFLEADAKRTKHRPSFRTAAHILHWGHPPLSYQGAEALLRAAHIEPKVKRMLEHVVAEVVSFGSLRCLEDDHEARCAKTILSGEHPFELYRWLAAWIAAENWSRLWSAICEAEAALGAKPPEEAETKKDLARILVCRESRGYEVLAACNRADFVPRDLLQCGTAWLTVDPDVLWEADPIGPDAADEWALIESARSYLEQRFYTTPTSLLVHTLVSRIIANNLVRKPFGVDDLRELLKTPEGDVYFDKSLRPYHREPFLWLKDNARHDLGSTWFEVGTFRDVSLPDHSRFGAEDFLTGRTGRGRLSYPLHDHYSVFVEFRSLPPFTARMAGSGRRYADVYCHFRVRDDEQKAVPLLNVLAKASDWINRDHSHEVGDALLSWLLGRVVRQKTSAITAVCSELVAADRDFFGGAVQKLRNRPSFVELNEHQNAAFQAELFADPSFQAFFKGAGSFLLRLPWGATRLVAGKSIFERLRSTALTRAGDGSDDKRGAALELAVAADQILAEGDCSHRFLILNPTEMSEERQPVREWDVVRIDLLRNRTWTVTAIECAVNRTTKKDEKARESLHILQEALRKSYSDLASYQTFLASIGTDTPSYEDAGRSYTPTQS